ncbi:MAG TPA: hypothetical protein VHU80_22020, partial [Polyangiaceae bacterium]|nr:hypothetical protein [Polyangiaceae bacterium]
ALFLFGCGGSQPDAKQAGAESAQSTSESGTRTEVSHDTSETESAESKAASDDAPAKAESGSAGDPTFPPGASVDQATAAVPKGAARSNLDADRLAEPLQQESVYEPCKVGTQHFKVRVAVWAGQAVGVDVTTPNKKLAECVDKQIRALSWPDKIRSLNTVEFSF